MMVQAPVGGKGQIPRQAVLVGANPLHEFSPGHRAKPASGRSSSLHCAERTASTAWRHPEQVRRDLPTLPYCYLAERR